VALKYRYTVSVAKKKLTAGGTEPQPVSGGGVVVTRWRVKVAPGDGTMTSDDGADVPRALRTVTVAEPGAAISEPSTVASN